MLLGHNSHCKICDILKNHKTSNFIRNSLYCFRSNLSTDLLLNIWLDENQNTPALIKYLKSHSVTRITLDVCTRTKNPKYFVAMQEVYSHLLATN